MIGVRTSALIMARYLRAHPEALFEVETANFRAHRVAFETLPPCLSGVAREACPERLGLALANLPASLRDGAIPRAVQVFMDYGRRHQQQLTPRGMSGGRN